jgi:hypothetical protein
MMTALQSLIITINSQEMTAYDSLHSNWTDLSLFCSELRLISDLQLTTF